MMCAIDEALHHLIYMPVAKLCAPSSPSSFPSFIFPIVKSTQPSSPSFIYLIILPVANEIATTCMILIGIKTPQSQLTLTLTRVARLKASIYIYISIHVYMRPGHHRAAATATNQGSYQYDMIELSVGEIIEYLSGRIAHCLAVHHPDSPSLAAT